MDTKKLIGSAVGLVATGVLLYAGYYIATKYIFKSKAAPSVGGETMQNASGDYFVKTTACPEGYVTQGRNCVRAKR